MLMQLHLSGVIFRSHCSHEAWACSGALSFKNAWQQKRYSSRDRWLLAAAWERWWERERKAHTGNQLKSECFTALILLVEKCIHDNMAVLRSPLFLLRAMKRVYLMPCLRLLIFCNTRMCACLCTSACVEEAWVSLLLPAHRLTCLDMSITADFYVSMAHLSLRNKHLRRNKRGWRPTILTHEPTQ